MDPNTAAVYLHLNELRRRIGEFDIRESPGPLEQGRLAEALDGMAGEADREIYEAFRRLEGEAGIRDEAAGFYRNLAALNSWVEGREAQSVAWIERAVDLAGSPELRARLADEHRRSVDRRDFAEVFRVAERGEGLKAHTWLRSMRKKETDPDRRRRIEEILAEPRNFVTPASAPGLNTINGIGTGLYGSRDARGDGTQVSTLCFCLIFIPLIPISSWLVTREGEGWRVFGKVPLSPFAVWWRRILLGLPAISIACAVAVGAYNGSDYTRETRELKAAREAIEQGDDETALVHLSRVAGSSNAGRDGECTALARGVLRRSLERVQTPDDVGRFLDTIGRRIHMNLGHRWIEDEIARLFEERLLAVAGQPGGGGACVRWLQWAYFVDFRFQHGIDRLSALACGPSDDPVLLAASARWHAERRSVCPPEILRKLRSRLERRDDLWDEHAAAYLLVAPPEEARPVLYARVERIWKVSETRDPEGRLVAEKGPAPLASLVRLDEEENLEARAAGLEKIADPGDLPEPQATWHRLGVARRLSSAYWEMDDLERSRPWTLRAYELAPESAMGQRAMLCFLAAGDLPRALDIGERHRGDERTDPYLGIVFARSGRTEEALRILGPYVERHWMEYHHALRDWRAGAAKIRNSLVEALQNGTADPAFVRRVEHLPRERQQREIELWIRQRIAGDPNLAKLEEVWKRLQPAHPAARELAMLHLEMGRAPGEKRKAHLETAERLFLELRMISDEDPDQELSLGQVYFWLGKTEQAVALFAGMEKKADLSTLLKIGEVHRQLGREDDARRVLERAYEGASGDLKERAALIRALTSRDLEDERLWLGRADAGDPFVAACRQDNEGRRLLEQGRYREAVEPLKKVAAYHLGLPESSTSANNAAGMYMVLFEATGDSTNLRESQRLYRRAHELSPEGGIVLTGYVTALRHTGYMTLAGAGLRVDVLHAFPSRHWLNFAGPESPADAVRSQPDLRRATELGVRLTMLAAERDQGFEVQIEYWTLTRDSEGLRKMRRSLEAEPPQRSAQSDDDPTILRRGMLNVERQERNLAEVRKTGHAPTLALALDSLARSHYWGVLRGGKSASLDRALECAEEARRVMDVPATRMHLALLRAEKASEALAERDGTYRTWVSKSRTMSPIFRLWLYPPAREFLRTRPEIVEAAESVSALIPKQGGVEEWALLSLAAHSAAGELRKALVAETMHLDGPVISWMLNRGSLSDAAGAFATAKILGDESLARRIADRSTKDGIVLPFFPK